MTIYRAYEMDRFYSNYGLSVPSNVPQYDNLIVRPAEAVVKPIFSRLFNVGNISVIYGRAGCGKTPLQMSICYALAARSSLDEMHTLGSESQSCLVVSGEMSGNQMGKIMGWNERIFPKGHQNTFVEIANYPWKLDASDGQNAFEDLIRRVNAVHPSQKNVSVIIFDNIKTLTSAGDNASKWGKFFDFLNTLRQSHGWTFIVIHHTHKGKGEDSFGTYDIDIKVDNKIYVGKDFETACSKVEGIDRWLPPEGDKDANKAYFSFVRAKTNDILSGKYTDSIWFYLALEKGRDFRTSEKLPLLMRMLPEDEHPKWDAIDILSDESAWSYKTFSGLPKPSSIASSEVNYETITGTDADSKTEDRKPSYNELLKYRSRSMTLKWLRQAYKEDFKTRQQMAEWLGCKKSDIDNLMNNSYYPKIMSQDLQS